MLEVFTGDDWDIIITLKRDGAVYNVSTASAISAALVSDDGPAPSTVVAAVSCSSGTSGADWANGVVVIEIPNATTAALTAQRAYVEIQVTIGGKKKTWPRQVIDIKKGVVA